MSELESSGLLGEEEPEPLGSSPGASAGGSIAEGGPTAGSADGGSAAADAEQAKAAAAAGPAGVQQADGSASSSAVGASGGPAEQKTLGRLADDPDWAKCLDTGSGSIYYWHMQTNQVLWDPPEGLDGEALVQGSGEAAPAAAEAAPAASEAAPAGSGEAQEAVPMEDEHQVAGAAPPATADPGAAAIAHAAAGSVAGPRDDVGAVFRTLLAELAAPAGAALAALPPAARMALEAQVRFADWQHWSAAQAAAAASGNAGAALGWDAYERHTMALLRAMFGELQAVLAAQPKSGAAAAGGAAGSGAVPPTPAQQQAEQPLTAGGKAEVRVAGNRRLGRGTGEQPACI